MNRSVIEKIAATVVLAAGVILVLVGMSRSHKVYDSATEEYGLAAFVRLSDWQLTQDATFGGVERREDKLYSTYDRAQAGGKRACPT